ncbi:hypothetical protein DMA11_10455 [Marinilabiliaceae bacterium JC017]|nr:hypothetical protein DMA11_10455 [Marinilabiliaceae bacterium JC017]
MKKSKKDVTQEQINLIMLDLKDDFSDLSIEEFVSNKQKRALRLRIYGRMMKLTRMAKQLLQEGGAA